MQTKNYLWLLVILWQCSMMALPLQKSQWDTEPAAGAVKDHPILEAELADAQLFLLEQKATIKILREQLEQERAKQHLLQDKATSVYLFGVQSDKSVYIKVTAVAIWTLFVVAIVLAFRTRFAIQETNRARLALTDLEEEYNEHIHKSLEREQKLRRQLQDEINRQKISDAS